MLSFDMMAFVSEVWIFHKRIWEIVSVQCEKDASTDLRTGLLYAHMRS
jgi:hypothetical protein